MGKIPSYNKYLNVQRANRYAGARIKKDATQICEYVIRNGMKKGFKIKNTPAVLRCVWYAKNQREDPDNISSKIKFVLDGAVSAGLIKNDGWKYVRGFDHRFEVDKDHVRVEITEVEHESL